MKTVVKNDVLPSEGNRSYDRRPLNEDNPASDHACHYVTDNPTNEQTHWRQVANSNTGSLDFSPSKCDGANASVNKV